MSDVRADPGSFRDPRGRIYHAGEKVYRTVTEIGAKDYEFVRDSGLIERLQGDAGIIASKTVEKAVLGDRQDAAVRLIRVALLADSPPEALRAWVGVARRLYPVLDHGSAT